MKRILILVAFAMLMTGFAMPSSAEAQSRIAQQIVINGQMAYGVYVSAPGGGMQTFTCDSPQQYTTPDGAAQGWACYDGSTGEWLLNAVPPGAVQPPVVYQPQPKIFYQPAPVVVYRPAPVVVYREPVRPVIVAPAYPPSVVLGRAAINATSRIVAAAIARPRVIEREPIIVRPYVEVRRGPGRAYAEHSRAYAEHSHHRGNWHD